MQTPDMTVRWTICGTVVSVASSSRTIWDLQVYRWILLCLVGFAWQCQPALQLQLVLNEVGTVLGYCLLFVLLLTCFGRRWQFWPSFFTFRVARLIWRVFSGLVRFVIPRPRRLKQACQVAVIQLEGGTRCVVTIPVSRARIYLSLTDQVVFYGRSSRHGFQAVTGRNLSTGQHWGWA